MDEQEYYRQLVSDAEVISALLRDGQAREAGVVVEKPRARPNLNFIQRTISNMVSSNQRKISEQVKRIESAKKKNKQYMIRKPQETYFKHKKEKWTDEEILAHKKAMLACRIRFIRAVEGISAPEKAGIFEKPSLSKMCKSKNKLNSDRKNKEAKVKLRRASSHSSSSSVIICDDESDVEKNICSSKKLHGKMKKSRSQAWSNSNSSCCSSDLDMKDTKFIQKSRKKHHRGEKRCSRSSTSSSSSSCNDRRRSRSMSTSSCSSVDESKDESKKYYKRKRKKNRNYSGSNSDGSHHNEMSKQIKRHSSSHSGTSSVICISESDTESYTPSRYSEDCKKLSNRRKYRHDKQKTYSRKKKRKRHRTSSSSTEDDVVCVTDTQIVSIVLTDSDSECDSGDIPEDRCKGRAI